MPTDGTILRAALRYLAGDSPFGRPVAVIPCCRPDPDSPSGCTAQWHVKRKDHTPGKTPVVAWSVYQTRLPTEAEWRAWWRQWAGRCNIGTLTGAVSGVLLLDVDCHDPAADGRTTIRTKGLDVPRTPTVDTPSGGAHAWYAYPPDIKVGTLRNFQVRPEWPGLDARGDGGFAVFPPSLHVTGGTYDWRENTRDLPLAPCPAWLIDAFRRERKGDDGGPAVLEENELARLWLGPWTEGQRHGVACRLIGHEMAYGHGESETAAKLILWNRAACMPPKTEDDIRAHVHDMFNRYGVEIPEPAPAEVWEEAIGALPPVLLDRMDEGTLQQQAGALAAALRLGMSGPAGYAVALYIADGDVEMARGLYGRAARWAARPPKEGGQHAG